MATATIEPASPAVAPHPGSQNMPRWNVAELIDAPRFTWKNWAAMIGPGLVMGGSAIGAGEWLTGPLVTARYGGNLLWLATLSIVFQVVYNIEISRYALYSGEPIFTGKFRTLPGPSFWIWVYILLDFGALFPYLSSAAATPIFALVWGRMPNTKSAEVAWHLAGIGLTDAWTLRLLACSVFVLAMVPLIVGGKIYNSVRALMAFKIFTVFGFLLILAIGFSARDTWLEIASGFFKFGNVPVIAGEDSNGNEVLDPGEDWDGDGRLDPKEPRILDENGKSGPGMFEDLDGDGGYDGDKVDNVFVSLWQGRGWPTINLGVLSLLCAMVAIAGQGGLSNTPLSNYTRDQGWGMGHHVGAIPSVIGGHRLKLSHVGSVFLVTPESLARWKRWYRHVMRDQLAVWLPACFIGLALPSMLSVQFLHRGTESEKWTAAGMTAGNVGESVATTTGLPWLGGVFWFMTLFCGFLVLGPSLAATADGVVRRWLDVGWTASARMRKIDTKAIGRIYFFVLSIYAITGLAFLIFVPGEMLLTVATNIFNYALGFSCWHALAVNMVLLPAPLRPGWVVRIMLAVGGLFFLLLAGLTTYAALL